jgi:hypothetical protein
MEPTRFARPHEWRLAWLSFWFTPRRPPTSRAAHAPAVRPAPHSMVPSEANLQMQNVDIYYESIRQVYEQIINWPKRKPPLHERVIDATLGVVGVIFTLSVIPILPVLFVAIGSQVGLRIGSFSLTGATFGTFLIVWGIAFAGGLLLFILLLWINSRVDSRAEKPAGPPQTLSPEQLTFIAIYEAYKELKIFFVSHVEQHIRNSLKALRRALISDRSIRDYLIYREYRERMLSERQMPELMPASLGDDAETLSSFEFTPYEDGELSPSFPRQVKIARSFLQTFEKYAWFQLDADTKATLQALISFSEKIPYRLKQKEDLPAVLSILENLSKFTYAYLPEHKTYMEPEALKKLQADGAECLHQFSMEINNLTPYSPPEKQKEAKTELSPTMLQRLRNIFYGNVFFRFTIWFVLILALTSGAVFIINQRMTLSPDTMATLVIGASVASAATLAAFLPRGSKPK